MQQHEFVLNVIESVFMLKARIKLRCTWHWLTAQCKKGMHRCNKSFGLHSNKLNKCTFMNQSYNYSNMSVRCCKTCRRNMVFKCIRFISFLNDLLERPINLDKLNPVNPMFMANSIKCKISYSWKKNTTVWRISLIKNIPNKTYTWTTVFRILHT